MSREPGHKKTGRCPICKAPSEAEYRPFCSRGCRDRDLLSWFSEGYRLPGASAPGSAFEDRPGEGDEDDGDRRED